MQPFLLAFVDSLSLEVLLLPLVLAVAAVGLVLVLTRSGLRAARRLRSPTVAATGWQYLGIMGRLLPAVFIGFVVLVVWLSSLHNDHLEHRGAIAYDEALHRKEVRRRTKVAGHYVLADSVRLAPDPAPRGRPRVELWLQPDGMFTYRSTLVGDAAGTQAAGSWRLEGHTGERTMLGLRKLHDYAILLEGLPLLNEQTAPLSGSLADEEEPPTVKLAGICYQQGQARAFSLTRIPDTLAPQAR